MAEVVDVLLRARMEASGVETGVGQIQKALKGLTLPKGISDDLEKSFNKLNPLLKDYQRQLNKGFSNKKDLQNFIALKNKIDEVFGDINSKIQQVNSKEIRLKTDTKAIEDAEKKVTKLSGDLQKAMDSIITKKVNPSNINAQFDKILNSFTRATTLKPMTQTAKNFFNAGDFAAYNAELDKMQNKINSLSVSSKFNFAKTIGFKGTIQDINGINNQINNFFNNIKANEGKVQTIERLRQELSAAGQEASKLKLDAAARGAQGLANAASGIQNISSSLRNVGDGAQQAASGLLSAKEQVEQLKYSTQYFFSLRNMFSLLKRGIDDAIESVKNLDKAMTETAVVTDFSVADMWNMLPEYTALANKLGATTQGAYETMTLYFQQGLDKQQTFEIGEETMKMARIAGLDYADTTNMMTAALRGFNMELNKTSAERVNDVYSKLAAITASDTRELGQAMERTASIAHSANMDFGNTTAFLAQMIETTREAPENLGTAMKTIIARFQELKANPYEISEVEGEEVDFNRVDKALKSIGVDLMDNRDKFRDLDDVFMDIASKWDGLSQTQQRYIATTAAGSRQQSRFLAMVQNYDRLKELTDAAANSEGASQVQFNKTLESFESKVNKLKNAWQAFTMSIANNQIIKGAVGGLTSILDTTNNLINTLSRGNGIVKSFLSLFTAFAGLKVGGRVVNSLVGALGGLVDPQTSVFAGLRGGFTGNRQAGNAAFASQINQPIVNAINHLTAIMSRTEAVKQGVQNNRQRSDLINQRRGNIYDIMQTSSNGFNVKDIKKQIKGLSVAEQHAIYNNSPVLQKALQRSYTDAYKKLNLTPEAMSMLEQHQKNINQKMRSGQISIQEGLRHLYNPYQVGQELGGQTAEEIQKGLLRQFQQSGRDYFKISEKISKAADKKGLTGQARTDWINSAKLKAASQLFGNSTTANITKTQSAVLGLSKSANGAGQSIMGLGMALQAAGFQTAGAMFMNIGNGIIGIGMAAEGAASGVSKLGVAVKAIGLGSVIGVGAGIAALGALVAGVVLYMKHQKELVKETQKAAKEVTNSYENIKEETQANISKLTEYKEAFAQLSEGVDSNGNNINLGTEEYSDYLKIVNEIAKMHPELVKGYNASGNAILENSKAVETAIEAEKKRLQTAEEEYTSIESLQKLIEGRNSTKRWQVGQNVSQGGHWEKIEDGEDTSGMRTSMGSKWVVEETSTLKKHAQEVVDTIQKIDPTGELLKSFESQYGLIDGALLNLDEKGIRAIQEHGASMLDQTKNQYKDAGEDIQTLIDDLNDSVAQVGKDTEGIEEVVEPIYKALSTYASQAGLFDNIPDEFRAAAEKGIKEIANLSIGENGKDITGAEMQKRVREVAQEVENLNGHSDDYQKALLDMDKAQRQYTKNLDKKAYGAAIADEIGQLMRWRDEALQIYENEGEESQRIIAESLQNQIEAYDKFISNGGKTLADGLNQHRAELERAATAYETFQKQTEGINDYYTGSDNMKQIIDDIKDGVDDLGEGSQTFWKGAAELMGEDVIKGKSFSSVNKTIGAFKDMFYNSEGEAREAQDTVDKFYSYVQDRQDELVKGTGGQTVGDLFKVTDDEVNLDNMANLTADQFANLAASLGMSDQMLSSMLNKARQFGGISFSNLDVLRGALVTMDGTQEGKNVNKNDEKRIYARRSTFEAEAEAQGYTYNEIDDLAKELRTKNVRLLSDVDEMGIKELRQATKQMGIESGQEFISAFSELGYGKGEIQSLYEKLLSSDKVGKALKKDLDLGDKTFGEAYNDFIDERDLGEDNTADENTADNTAQIAANTSAILAAVGGLDVDKFDEGDKADNPWNDGKTYYEGKGYNALKKVFGGEGRDTMAQNFAKGLTKGGAELNPEQYQKNYNTLLKMQEDYDSKAAQLEIAANNASDQKEAERFNRQAEYYRRAAEGVENYLKKGEEAHLQWLKNNEEEIESDNNKTKNKKKNNEEESLSAEQKAQRERNAKNAAWTSKPEESTDTESSSTTKPNTADIQAKFNSIATRGFSGLISGLTPESIKTPEAQNALNSIYKTALSSTIDNPATLTKDLVSDFKTLGINVQDAIDAGLVVDKNNILSKAKKTGKDTSEAAAQGTESGLDSSDTSNVKSKGKSKGKKIADDAAKGTSEGVSEGGKKKPQKQQKAQQSEKTDVPEESTYTIEADYKEVNKAQKAINKLKDAADSGANFEIEVSGSTELKKAANAAKKLSNNAGEKTINVKTGEVDKSSIKDAKQDINNTKAKIKVGADVSKALEKAEEARSTIDGKSATIDVSTSVTGQNVDIYVTKHITEKGPATGGFITTGGVLYRAKGGLASYPKKGTDRIPAYLTPGEYVQNRKAVQYFGIDFMREINHKNLLGALQSFGSTAKGSRRGRIGPNDNGGLTLTGEEGFEIAWLPSENRSMILGERGPQMVNLPSDAVIYTHKQSKDILRKKQSISAGSSWRGRQDRHPGGNSGRNSGGGGNSGGGSNGSHSGGSGGDGGQSKKIGKKHIKILQRAGKINSWWWNMTKKVEATQRKIDSINKNVEKLLGKVGTTLESIGEEANKYVQALRDQIVLNTRMRDKANEKLDTINTKKTGKRTKDAQKQVKKDRKKLDKAKRTDSKKDDKKAKKQLKKDRKKLRKTQKGVNWANISYEATKKITQKGKKTKKKKVTKKDRVNLSKFIYFDPETGEYQIDDRAIKKKYGNTKKGQAVREAAEKRLDNYIGKRDTAEDNIDKAQEALDELGQKLYDTFFGWETELTRIWNITQKIAEAEGNRERAESFSDLLDAQIGDDTVKIIDEFGNTNTNYIEKIKTTFAKGVNEQIDAIKLTALSIGARALDLKKTLDTSDEEETLANITRLVENSEAYYEALKDQKVAQGKLGDLEEKRGTADDAVTKAKDKKQDLKTKLKDKDNTKKEKAKLKKQIKKAKEQVQDAKDARDKVYKKTEEAVKTQQDAIDEANSIMSSYGADEILDDTKTQAYKAYQKELQNEVEAMKMAHDYMNPRQNDDGTVSINFDSDAFEQDKQAGKITNEAAERIQNYVKKLVDDSNDLRDTYKDLTDKLTELHTSLADLKEAWVGYSEDLMSFLEDEQEEQIDKYKALSDSIKDALDKLLDQVKKNLDERRKQEDNAKTERDISQKQQRLAALRADTSGGHQVEIAQLEKEIAEAQVDYGRTLEDQLLDRLESQADAAAEQRERIIELQQAINSSVNNAAKVNEWMSNPERYKDEIRQAFFTAKGWADMPLPGQEALETQFNQLYAGLLTNQDKQAVLVDAINATTEEVQVVEGSLGSVGLINAANLGNTNLLEAELRSIANTLNSNILDTKAVSEAVQQAVEELAEGIPSQALSNYNTALFGGTATGAITGLGLLNLNKLAEEANIDAEEHLENLLENYAANDLFKAALTDPTRETPLTTADVVKTSQYYGAGVKTTFVQTRDVALSGDNKITNKEAVDVISTASATGKTAAQTFNLLTGKGNEGNKQAVANMVASGEYSNKDIKAAAKAAGMSTKAINAAIANGKKKKYAKGGLADYTGPAWLDGTPSKPELVLNSTDTKNFIALRDVLSKSMGNIHNSNETLTNTSYEININVDHINNDYDVDKIAARIKKDIVKDAGYRNVTQVRNLR